MAKLRRKEAELLVRERHLRPLADPVKLDDVRGGNIHDNEDADEDDDDDNDDESAPLPAATASNGRR